MNEKNKSLFNDVKNRFLPLPKSSLEGLEHEPSPTDFNVIKGLGIGSFGKVYLVSHKKTKALYAVKAIDKHEKVNIEERGNFIREIEIMYKLDHPNIVKLYGHFEDEHFCYFIMQYIPNKSTYNLIPKNGVQKNIKLIASIMKDLLKAVYYLHNMKPVIIHRDIKPENVLLDEKNKAYLTDFGWSNYVSKLKRRNTLCGTPIYLPPEMASDIGHNETVDIWNIGVLLFELTAGKPPFEGKELDVIQKNVMNLRIRWPPRMDPDAKDLISKILKINPNERLKIEQILNHKFFTKFFPNAVKELTKPTNEKKKTFIISKDNPKTWGKPSHNIRRSTMLPNYSNYKNKFKKVQIDTSIIRTNHLSPTNRRNHIVLSSPNSKTNLLSTSSSKKSILSSINSRGMALSPRKDNHYITNIIERTKNRRVQRNNYAKYSSRNNTSSNNISYNNHSMNNNEQYNKNNVDKIIIGYNYKKSNYVKINLNTNSNRKVNNNKNNIRDKKKNLSSINDINSYRISNNNQNNIYNKFRMSDYHKNKNISNSKRGNHTVISCNNIYNNHTIYKSPKVTLNHTTYKDSNYRRIFSNKNFRSHIIYNSVNNN